MAQRAAGHLSGVSLSPALASEVPAYLDICSQLLGSVGDILEQHGPHRDIVALPHGRPHAQAGSVLAIAFLK